MIEASAVCIAIALGAMLERSLRTPTNLCIVVGVLFFILATLLLLVLALMPQWDPLLAGTWFHFQIVSFTSLVALVLAILIILLTGSVSSVRTLFRTLGLAAIAGIFLIHGLATPGVLLLEPNPAVRWSGAISLFAGAVLHALASVDWSPSVRSWILDHRRFLWAAAAVAYLAYAAVAFASPSPLQVLSRLSPTSTYVLAFLTLVLYLGAALRFWRTYRRTQSHFAAIAAIGMVLLAEAVIPMVFSPVWKLSWWLYHVLMLVAFGLGAVGVVLEYEQTRHFHLTYYFGAISAVAVALLAWIAGEVAVRTFGSLVEPADMRRLRFGTSGILLGTFSVLFLLLLQIVRRGDRLLAQRTVELQQQQAVLERSRMAGALVPIGLAIGRTLDLDRVLSLICEESMTLFDVDAARVWLREGDELVARAGRGDKSETFVGIRQKVSDEELLSARIVRERRAFFVNDAQAADGIKQECVEKLGAKALLGVPLLKDDKALGSLILIDVHRSDRFTQVDLDVAAIFGQQAAMALTHAHLYEQTQEQADALAEALYELRESYRATLKALSFALDARDRETEGHSQRVRAYALRIADEMGVTDPTLREAVQWGALLHDIGKIGIPDAVLHKPGPLSDEEWALMYQHPLIGYEILSGIPFLESALPVVLYHHERWDGSGYPAGKQGEEIPLPARIFAVADAFDALTSSRPYRSPVSFREAREEIIAKRRIQFDPAVVDAFRRIPIDVWLQLAKRVGQHSLTVELHSDGAQSRYEQWQHTSEGVRWR